jgi:hypothetical protein
MNKVMMIIIEILQLIQENLNLLSRWILLHLQSCLIIVQEHREFEAMYEMMEMIHNDRRLRLIENKIDEMIQVELN